MGQYVQVDDKVKIYIEDIGQGVPVIFLHGWPANHLMFEYQYTLLASHGYRCIGMDIRGFGKSDAPWESYSYDRMADDLRAVIDELQLENAALVGFSMGGAIASRYMSRHNGHGIKRLLLVGAATPAFTRRPGMEYGMEPDEVTAQLIHATYENRPAMLNKFGLKFTKTKSNPGMLVWLESLCYQASHHGTIKAAASLRDEDLREDLAAIQIPTVVFHGQKDKIVEPELGELTSQSIAGSRIVRFEDSGHAMLFDEPEKFNEELLTFLDGMKMEYDSLNSVEPQRSL
ncbi:alpha/beta fold hydrolase [Paenibacillus sp. P13VS]|uniref:alpha/beta fold hydrolase n=1 Tax=Paenibacillus sp. P13VS TaxID=2697367 RepID=UPI00187BA1FB|nr:alpha/beta hydrolase [Paenibacillus sp. P13VS]MBE7679909.1 alpha/beta fold hydrolase [Paenibacillus sp. P13VS]